jgi:hypothetical protein
MPERHDYEIDTGIPVPPVERREQRVARRYPFNLMKPGDSFLIPAETDQDARAAQAAAMSAWRHRRDTGWEFTSRRVAEGIRVWRTK